MYHPRFHLPRAIASAALILVVRLPASRHAPDQHCGGDPGTQPQRPLGVSGLALRSGVNQSTEASGGETDGGTEALGAGGETDEAAREDAESAVVDAMLAAAIVAAKDAREELRLAIEEYKNEELRLAIDQGDDCSDDLW